ncbi:MAG: glycosyltransferase [Planctomycetia bacterium]|nr:glycosyltransferase [Planctomycetia bacterium]
MAKRILVSPLSWGLGHATRDLPVIREFLRRGHHVTVAATGRGFTLLQQEVPECEFVELKDYPVPYSHSRFFLPRFVWSMPKMLSAMKRERLAVGKFLRENRFDIIVSDNRFNVYHRGIPTFFISHQVRFKLPSHLAWFEPLTEKFNQNYYRRFLRVIIPDIEDEERNLTGRLAHGLWFSAPGKIYYAGILSSVQRMDVDEDIDYFISVSGPEPQRTVFEKIILAQASRLAPARIVITLGKPEARGVRELGRGIKVHSYLDRRGQQEMMNRAKMVVCRSGYTTVMELAELGKKALFVPTPGQTEQEYLSRMYERKGLFHSVSQYDLDLKRDVELAAEMPGIDLVDTTASNVARLYEDVFAPYLT